MDQRTREACGIMILPSLAIGGVGSSGSDPPCMLAPQRCNGRYTLFPPLSGRPKQLTVSQVVSACVPQGLDPRFTPRHKDQVPLSVHLRLCSMVSNHKVDSGRTCVPPDAASFRRITARFPSQTLECCWPEAVSRGRSTGSTMSVLQRGGFCVVMGARTGHRAILGSRSLC
jgi:hypothetical protein